MRGLQAYILERLLGFRGWTSRKIFRDYYRERSSSPKVKDQVDAITRAFDALIGRGYLQGSGVRTAEKWFIKEVRLTPAGRRAATRRQGEQQKLPLTNNK